MNKEQKDFIIFGSSFILFFLSLISCLILTIHYPTVTLITVIIIGLKIGLLMYNDLGDKK